MRRPHSSCEKKETHQACPQQSSSGALARMRRFLITSLGGRPSPPAALSSIPATCDVHCASTSQVITSLKREAQLVVGRPLEEVITEVPHGVPTIVHELCCWMLTHGVDYETLVGEEWCPGPNLSSLEDIGCIGQNETSDIARLFRIYLQGLPDPLLSSEATTSLSRVSKELESLEGGRDIDRFQEVALRLRRILCKKVAPPQLQLLQYLATFFHQLRTANHNTCPVNPSALSRLLGRILTERGMKGASDPTAFRLAEMLLVNHSVIFRDAQVHLTHDTSYSSDSVSSTYDSSGETSDDGDLFTPDDDDDCRRPLSSMLASSVEADSSNNDNEPEDDSTTTTTTTTDTDEFRSLPMSPIKRCPADDNTNNDDDGLLLSTTSMSMSSSVPGTSSPVMKGSTDEISNEGGGFISKIAPYGKNYLPSITGLLTSPYDSWGCFDDFGTNNSADTDSLYEPGVDSSSCISGSEISELSSDGDRDADGSDNEGGPDRDRRMGEHEDPSRQMTPCPHEERRSTERMLLRGIHAGTARKPKRRIRRKHTRDSSRIKSTEESSRVQSSEEEDRPSAPLSSLSSLILHDSSPPLPYDPSPPVSYDTSPTLAYDPSPPTSPSSSQPFSELISSSEPIPSDRAPSNWGLRHDEETENNWQRTAPHHFPGEGVADVDPVTPSNWPGRVEDDERYHQAKFRDPMHFADHLEEGKSKGHSAVKTLSKNISGLKKKIKRFEEDFERTFGYRPSHADKMKHKDVKKYMTDLSKAKKELKQMKEDLPEKKIRNQSKPFPISLLRCQESTSTSQNSSTSNPTLPLTKDTYRKVEERLSEKRTIAGRPYEVADLSLDELKEEKTDIQKALLFYESIHGRPSTRDDRELVRPLYDRYRLIKRSVYKFSSRLKESASELPPIFEHVVMDFTTSSPQHRGGLQEEEESEECAEEENPPPCSSSLEDIPSPTSSSDYPLNPDPHPEIRPATATVLNLGDLHALPIHELKERRRVAREGKKRLRVGLREFEEKFERETGRKLQKEDRGPMEKHYNEYKLVKAKLRLLDALLSKHDS